MNVRKTLSILSAALIIVCFVRSTLPQEQGLNSITAEELKLHLSILAADEFRGRDTPSSELKITSRYIALMAQNYGFKPLMPDGSYYQEIPLEVTTISEAKTKISISTDLGELVFKFPQAFGFSRYSNTEGTFSGDIVCVGFGLEAPDYGWDDYGDIDLTGKIVVMFDGRLPADHILNQPEHRRMLRRRSFTARQKGAAAVLTVVSEERQDNLVQNGLNFDNPARSRVIEKNEVQRQSAQTRPFLMAEIRHEVASVILGISQDELDSMFTLISSGQQVPGMEVSGRTVEISAGLERHLDKTYNVVAYLEGSDEQLKNEYIVYGSHHDHIGVREGNVFNGADDNGSGTVAMLEIAQAMMLERPKRSVILVWHTGEEKGLWGSYFFVRNCPVPVENISANINLDMLCRNDPNHLYLIGSKVISTEYDSLIHMVNNRYTHMLFDYKYEDPAHSDRFFFRSDHYPYLQYGIPAVWFFCGTTEDYHQPTDTIDRVDFGKMETVTKLVYLAGLEIANMDVMLMLNAHPDITSRGQHNTSIRWR